MMGLSTLRARLIRLGEVDIRLALWTALVLGIGCVFVYSSSALLAQRSAIYGYESDYFFKKQILAAAIGLTLCVLMATAVSWKQIERWSGWVMAFAMVCLCLVFVPGIGQGASHVNRWIRLAGVSFQPAELAKLALVLYLAKFISDRESRWIGVQATLKILTIAGLTAFLIYKEPDYSTAVFVLSLTLLMLFLGGLSWSHILATLGLIAAIGIYGIATKSYIVNRLQAYLKPWDDPGAKGFQILQSYIALGHGGLSGAGLGQSLQKTALLPEPHTDFIFAVIGEETGFIGTTTLAVLYLAFFIYGLRLALRMPNLFLKLGTSGIVFLIVSQALLNMTVVTGLTPVAGEPLPLVSAGGTSVVVTLLGIGCLLNFSREAVENPENEIRSTGAR